MLGRLVLPMSHQLLELVASLLQPLLNRGRIAPANSFRDLFVFGLYVRPKERSDEFLALQRENR